MFRFLAITAFVCGFAMYVSAQSYAGSGFQSNQIGSNAFVSSPKGEVYLLNTHRDTGDSWDRQLYNPLYRSTLDTGDSWEKLAPNVKAVALDPQNEKVIYGINTDNHVIKSLDAGKQWLTLNTGFPNLTLLTIYVNPSDSQEVLIGSANGLFRTTDAGFTWHPTSFTFAVTQIVLDPHSNSKRFLLSDGKIFVSTDSGSTWKKSETGLPTELVRSAGRTATKVTARISLLFFVDWEKPFLLATTVGKGVYRSEDGGASWKPSGTGLSETFLSASVGRQSIILSSNNNLYRSVDGLIWNKVNIRMGNDSPGTYLGVIEYPKRDGYLLYFRFPGDGTIENIGEQRRLGFVDAKDVLIGLNYGVLSHSEVDHVWTSNINGHPALFAVTANQYDLDQPGAYRRPTILSVSTDDGYSWKLLGVPVCGGLAANPRGSSTEIWVYGTDISCIMRSQDGGLSWIKMPGVQLRYSNASVSRLVPDPRDSNIAYYCVGVNEYKVYRYQYDPATKQGVSMDLKTEATEVLVDDSNRLSLYTNKGMLSTDGGWTWIDKSSSITKSLGVDLGSYFPNFTLISFRNGEIVGIVNHIQDIMSGSGTITVVKSADSGSTWQKVSVVNTRIPEYGRHPQIFFNSNDSSNFFLVGSDSSKVRLLETKDSGQTWREIYSRSMTRDESGQYRQIIQSVSQVTEGTGRRLLIGGRYGLWTSIDEGATWKILGGLQ
jgi:photosystem II stability/assembly factor-like uncharacterized protein